MLVDDDKYGLKPVWDALLEIYDAFVSICEKNGLRYYLSDGTALGAVRHGGFIPWDDDFDVSMPREDYEKFIDIASDQLPKHLTFVNWRNTPEFPLLFGKIHDTRKERIEAIERKIGKPLSSGLFIDIFPIDGYPESRLERMLVYVVNIPLSCIVRFRCMSYRQQTKKGKLVWLTGLVFNVLIPFVSGQHCKSICEKILRRHPFGSAKETGRASLRLTVLNRKPMPKSWWGAGTIRLFCGRECVLPESYDEWLGFYYGDYMKLPPDDMRHPSHQYSWRCPWWLGPTNTV